MPDLPRLGERGGGWVVLQFPLMGLVIAAGIISPGWPERVSGPLSVAGALVATGGGALAVLAARVLGPSLTPFPQPSRPARFVERGPYGIVRHPIYLGGILFFVGFSLAFSPWALVGTAALGVLWGLKSRVEERFLLARYPEYASYRERTRFRLLPFVY